MGRDYPPWPAQLGSDHPGGDFLFFLFPFLLGLLGVTLVNQTVQVSGAQVHNPSSVHCTVYSPGVTFCRTPFHPHYSFMDKEKRSVCLDIVTQLQQYAGELGLKTEKTPKQPSSLPGHPDVSHLLIFPPWLISSYQWCKKQFTKVQNI